MAADVRLAGADDLEAMGLALARAFADDPIYRFIYDRTDDPGRAVRLAPFFVALAKARLPLAGVWTDGGTASGALWLPPGQKVSAMAELRAGWRVHLRMGVRPMRRGMQVMQAVRKAHPKEPHWYLETLGTDPDHQGKGIGSALLAPVLERCDREGVPAYLESSKQANVPFYERHGFRVTGELPVGDRREGAPTLWTMWRDPG